MLLDLLKRMSASLLLHHTAGEDRNVEAPHNPNEPLPAALPGETSWHGDHWANLLSSPMDARHYVLEDWSTPRPVGLFET
jgi:hypothetical protein